MYGKTFYGPPHDTTPAAVKSSKNLFKSSFTSREYIQMRQREPYFEVSASEVNRKAMIRN